MFAVLNSSKGGRSTIWKRSWSFPVNFH